MNENMIILKSIIMKSYKHVIEFTTLNNHCQI